MKEQFININSEYIRRLPSWAKELATKYYTKTANLYLIHGNIRDFLPHITIENEFQVLRIQEFISEALFGFNGIIIYFDRSSGISFGNSKMRGTYLDVMHKLYSERHDDELLTYVPCQALEYLEKFIHKQVSVQGKNWRIVLLIDYAETIVPANEISKLSEEDRYSFVTLNRWSHEPMFTQADVSIILLTENLSDLNSRLSTNPSTIKVEIPFPDDVVRKNFLQSLYDKGKLLLSEKLDCHKVAILTSGLNLMNLNRLSAESYEDNKPLSMDYLRQMKKEMIEAEAGGLLEFIETKHTLAHVSGHDFVKRRFQNAAKAIKNGRLDVLPIGYLIAGPVGTGKSFMVSAFAGEIGVPMVKFHNFRSKWQGVTESNLEKVLSILKAMAPVAVMIDEADAFLGNRNQEGDSGVSNRVFSQIANFMGNTDYRGKIIWFLITCRPDLLPIDLKRQGRAEEHLALFYPETDEEKISLFETLVKKLDLQIRQFPIKDMLRNFKYEFSGADLESILTRAKFIATMDSRTFINKADLEQTLLDFVPPAYPHALQLQNLVAVLECTSKEMVPKRFRNLDQSRLVKDIQELKTLLGEVP